MWNKSIKFQPQLNSSDCGAACLVMISNYLGRFTNLEEVKELFTSTRIGVSLQDIIVASGELGLHAHPLKLSKSDVFEIELPILLFWNQDHFILLESIIKKKKGVFYKIVDPSFGKILVDEDTFYTNWIGANTKGICVFFERTEDQPEIQRVKKDTNKSKGNSLIGHAKVFISQNRWKYTLALTLLTIGLLANFLIPFIFQRIIDDGIGKKAIHVVFTLVIAQFVVFMSAFLSDFFSTILTTKINFFLSISLKENFLKKIMKLPISYFDSRLNSETYQRVQDQNKIQTFLTWKGIDFLLNSLNIIVFGTILWMFSPIVFTMFISLTVLSTIWVLLFLKKRGANDYSLFYRNSEYQNRIFEFIMNMPEIKINNAQDKMIDRILHVQHNLNRLELRSLLLNMYQNAGVNLLSKIGELFSIVYCAILIVQDNMTLGTLLSISYIIGQLTRPLQNTVTYVQDAQDASNANKRINDIYTHPNENNTNSLSIKNESISKISLDDVSFSYPGTYNVFALENISFEIPRNSVTAIVGHSGSGKTTLLKLLLSYYHPTQGSIKLDDFDMNYVNSGDWRQKCGIVMQDGVIFSGSIAENIALSDPEIDAEMLKNAADVACLNEFVQDLPMGFNTKIGRNGIELSGGQKQRILIARAIYKNPEFVFLDEATSALDSENERKIYENLSHFLKNKTVLIIAHRLSTVKNADQIIVIRKGRIIEIGKHEILIKNKGDYYSLVSNQLELAQ